MTDTQLSPDRSTLEDTVPVAGSTELHGETRRFRAATYEDALDDATEELGPGLEVVEANRIRRGGLGGFFATDLGVEITVVAGEPGAQPRSDSRPIGPNRPSAIDEPATGGPATDEPAIRPYLPADLTAPDGGADGTLTGQSLGMTDERLQQLLDRADEAERSARQPLPRRQPASPPPSFGEHMDAARGDGTAAPTVAAPRVDTSSIPAIDDAVSPAPMVAAPRVDESSAPPTAGDDAGTGAGDDGSMARAGEDPIADDVEGPVLPAADRPRLPARLHAPVARTAPSGFIDEYPSREAPDEILHPDQLAAEMGEMGEMGEMTEMGEMGADLAESHAATGELGGLVMSGEAVDVDAGGPATAADDAGAIDEVSAVIGHMATAAADWVESAVAPSIESDPGCPVAVVVPMAGSIDEPMAPITGAPNAAAIHPGSSVGMAPTAPEVALSRADGPVAPETRPAPADAGVRDRMVFRSTDPVLRDRPTEATAGTTVEPAAASLAPTELVAAATDRLVAELDKMVVAEGSRLHEMDRLRVAVTNPDGSRIEMAVELAGDDE